MVVDWTYYRANSSPLLSRLSSWIYLKGTLPLPGPQMKEDWPGCSANSHGALVSYTNQDHYKYQYSPVGEMVLKEGMVAVREQGTVNLTTVVWNQEANYYAQFCELLQAQIATLLKCPENTFTCIKPAGMATIYWRWKAMNNSIVRLTSGDQQSLIDLGSLGRPIRTN